MYKTICRKLLSSIIPTPSIILMEKARPFFEIFVIVILEKNLVLFVILAFCYVILFLRFKVRFFLIKSKNLLFGGLWFRSKD